jgi:hypothetical protein
LSYFLLGFDTAFGNSPCNGRDGVAGHFDTFGIA